MAGMSPRIKAKKGRFGDLGLAAVVRIVSPVTGSAYVRAGSPLSAALTLVGIGTDDLTGDVSSSITWTSDLDGSLGTGASVDASLTTVGTHVITASVSYGSPAVVDTATITVVVS